MSEISLTNPEVSGVNPEDGQQSPSYRYAKHRVLMKKIFLLHALVYAFVNALLLIIDVLTGGGLWFYWAALGWGIGLVAHGVLFWSMSSKGFLSPEWEEKMIARELQRHAS